MTELLAELKGVSRTYRTGSTSVAAVIGVSLVLRSRDRVALTGPSGSGKTTLLSVLGLLERPDAGQVSLLGQRVDNRGSDELADLRRAHIGLVFQQFHLVAALSAIDNICLPLAPYASRTALRRRASDLLVRLGLAARMDHRPSELSGGEQQRVAIARSLIGDPSLVLADEPTGNLDSAASSTVLDLLREMQADADFALVVATHDEGVANTMDRRIHLHDGSMVRILAGDG